MLTTKIALNSNSVNGDLPFDLLECWSECKSKAVTVTISDCIKNEHKNFIRATSISDHLQSFGNVELKDEF